MRGNKQKLMQQYRYSINTKTALLQGVPKIIPYKKFYMSVIVADFSTKLTAFIDVDSGHIYYKFY